MIRSLTSLTLLLAASPVLAQPADEVIRLTVAPAAEPSPALKYHLLPPLRDLAPGNAVIHYYRAYSPEWLVHRREPGFDEKMDKWLRMPPRELPRGELTWVLNYGPLLELDLGARQEQCDWEMTARIRREGMALLLPDIQGFRDLANLLRLRARLQMAEGNYDQAVATLQTGFALGRHLSEVPNVICSLVGMAIVNLMTKEAESLIQMPGAPNFYWALTELPRPLIDLRKPMQGEEVMCEGLLPSLAELEKAPLSPRQVQELIQRLHQTGRVVKGGAPGSQAPHAGAQLALTGLVMKYYPQAKRFLLDQGRKPELVEAMPAPQVVTIYAVVHFQRLRDDLFKWVSVPYAEARAGLRRAAQERQKVCEGMGDGMSILFALLPALDKIVTAQARTDRHIAALRCIEAVRLHAAAHDGQLPRQLTEITEVPVPLDPVTGQPFEYRAEGARATLLARPPAGDSQPAPLHYEITLKR